MSRDFRQYFYEKNSTWAPYELRGHCVGVVNNYADTSMTMWTLFENFEGFSQILKEQSGKKRYLGVFTHPIAII